MSPEPTMGWLDQPSSSTLTRKQFGWEPVHPSLLDDLEAAHYPA